MNIKKIIVCIIVYISVAFATVYGLDKIFKRPIFSIIVSVYNYGEYLPKTIESVLSSTFSDYELIIVNDGSTDNSYEIMKSYAKKDRRIKLINQENQGLSIARNNAMQIAKGHYYWFVDADDLIAPHALHRMVTALQKSANANKGLWPDILSFYIQHISENGSYIPNDYYAYLPRAVLGFREKQYLGSQLPLWLLINFPVTSGKQIYRADYIKEKKISFPPRQLYEDDCFFLTTQLTGAKGIVVPEKLYYKRTHSRSIVNNRAKHYPDRVRLPKVLYQNLIEHGVSKDIALSLFSIYMGGVYGKWPNDAQFIPVLESLAQYMDGQTGGYWKNEAKKMRHFIQKKKEEHTAKEANKKE